MATWDLFHLEDEFSDFTPFFVKFTKKKIEILGKDSIQELQVLFTCNMNAQNLRTPFLSNSLIKWEIGVKMVYGNLVC